MTSHDSHLLIGTSGWHYEHRRERYYPRDLPTSRWLSHYAQTFPTVELTNDFIRGAAGWQR